MLILYSHIFLGGFEILNEFFKLLCMSQLLPLFCIIICTTVRIVFNVLLVVELFITIFCHLAE